MKSAKILLILFLSLAVSSNLLAQAQPEDSGNKDDYVSWLYGNEFLGSAHLYSFFIGYRFHQNFVAQLHFEYLLIPGANYDADYFVLPVTGSYIFGLAGNHYLEALGGATISIPAEMQYRTADRSGHRASMTSELVVPQVALGYRYHPSQAGWFFRVAMWGVYGKDPKTSVRKFRWWPGASIGRTF